MSALPAAAGDVEQESSFTALFQPRSVAVIGASDDITRIGGRPIHYLKRAAYGGAILPVNPNRTTVQGLAAFASVADIPGPVDIAIVALPAGQVPDAIDACAAKGVKAAIVFSAGFAETGPEGAALQQRIQATARRTGMRVVGPNCLGVFNSGLGFYGTFSQAFDKAAPGNGPIAIASQSGACGSHIAYLFQQRGVGIGHWITTGNEVDVDVGEALLWYARSPDTRVIVAYVEAVRDGATFVRALETARRNRKPVVLLKVGRSEVGGKAAASHTGALVGSDGVYDAILRQYGVFRARSIAELVDVAAACARGILPRDRSLGIVTLSGGLGIQAADAAEANGLDVRTLSASGQAQIKALVPFAGPANPIDVTAQVINDPVLAGRCIEVALEEGGYQSLICLLSSVPAVPKLGAAIMQALGGIRARYPERLIVLAMAAPPEVVRGYEDAGFLVFEDGDCAIAAIAALARLRESIDAATDAAPRVGKPVAGLPAEWDEHSAKAYLGEAGIPMLPEKVVQDGAEAASAAMEIGCPVVLKIVSPDIAHKTEVGGIVLNVQSPQEAATAAVALRERIAARVPGARITGVLVAPMAQGGVETICGVFTDPVFGPMVMFGLGGILVEVTRDVAFRLAPFDEPVARSMVDELRGRRIFDGVRGAAPSDLDTVVRTLVRLSEFAYDHRGVIDEVDINPFVVLAQGSGGYALDALIVPAQKSPAGAAA